MHDPEKPAPGFDPGLETGFRVHEQQAAME